MCYIKFKLREICPKVVVHGLINFREFIFILVQLFAIEYFPGKCWKWLLIDCNEVVGNYRRCKKREACRCLRRQFVRLFPYHRLWMASPNVFSTVSDQTSNAGGHRNSVPIRTDQYRHSSFALPLIDILQYPYFNIRQSDRPTFIISINPII